MMLLLVASLRAAMAYLAGCWLLISVTIFTTPNFRHARKSKLACRNPYFRYRYDETSELGENITTSSTGTRENFLCKMQVSIDSRIMSQDFYIVMFTIQASRDMFIKLKNEIKISSLIRYSLVYDTCI